MNPKLLFMSTPTSDSESVIKSLFLKENTHTTIEGINMNRICVWLNSELYEVWRINELHRIDLQMIRIIGDQTPIIYKNGLKSTAMLAKSTGMVKDSLWLFDSTNKRAIEYNV